GNRAGVMLSQISVRSLTIGATSLITSRLTNDFRFNYTGNKTRSQSSLDDFGGAVPFVLRNLRDANGQPTPGVDGFMATFFLGGFSQVSISDVINRQRQWNYVDTISYSASNHSLKAGFDYRELITPLVTFTSREFGTFTSRTQVVQGVISPMAQSLTLPLSPIYKNFSAFFQDDWRVNERL